MRACVRAYARGLRTAKEDEGGRKRAKEDDDAGGGSGRHAPLSLSSSSFFFSLFFFPLEQCKARVNGANMRGGQAGVTALSQVKSRLTPLITQI